MTLGVAVLGSIAFLLGSAPARSDSASPTNPVCWKTPRIYHPGGAKGLEIEHAAARVLQVRNVAATLGQPRTLSPNGAYAFSYSERANPGPPSGSTMVSLRVFNEKHTLLSLEADDVRSLQSPRWVNEKLIYFRLWLSRLAGVDVLVDVEEGRIVRMEAFSDGGTLWRQARDSCASEQHIPECDNACVTLK